MKGRNFFDQHTIIYPTQTKGMVKPGSRIKNTDFRTSSNIQCIKIMATLHFSRLPGNSVVQLCLSSYIYGIAKVSYLKSHTQALFCLALKSPFKMAVGVRGQQGQLSDVSKEDELLKEPCTSLWNPFSGCIQYLALTFPQNLPFALILSWYEEKRSTQQRHLIHVQAMIPQQ